MEEQQPAKLFESEEEQEKATKLLEERLVAHDKNRKAIQDKFKTIQNKLIEQIDELEERINRRLWEEFVFEEDRLQAALNELHENSTISAPKDTKTELYTIQSYEIIENKEANNDFTTMYELKIKRRIVPEVGSVGLAIPGVSSSIPVLSNTTEKKEITFSSDKLVEEHERLIELLEERLMKHDESRKAAQDKIHEICEGLRTKICELEERITQELEEKFISEDNRLQAAFNEVRGNKTERAFQKAKAELLVEQSYELIENKTKLDLTTLYKLKAERRIIPELMEMRKPTNVRVTGINRGSVSVQFTCLNPIEERVLSDNAIVNPVKYKCLFFKKNNEQEIKKDYPLDKDEDNIFSSFSFTFTPDTLEAETTYGIRVKIITGDRESEWSDEVAEFTPEFRKCCVWKKCPDDVEWKGKYSVDGRNLRIATKLNSRFNDRDYCTIIGSTSIPLNAVTLWTIKIFKSENNNGSGIYIGVAPSDINQNDYIRDNYKKFGWYFDCWDSTLWSGPPHNYNKYPYKEYGPRKRDGQYVHTGDNVGVVVDTSNGELSFVLNGVNFGVAYEGIPLDKPLVPCVLLRLEGDSVELDTSEVEETEVDSSIPVPFNITIKSISWDSITLTWDEVVGASFYQIEVDGSKSLELATTNIFTKRGLLPEIEHTFRVRTVRGSSVSEWSDVAKGRTLKAPEFSKCVWRKCPDYVKYWKYSVGEKNPRIATKTGGNSNNDCTIIGNTPIPLNKVTSWSIKVLKSEDNDGDGIFVGVAPSDINQNADNYGKYGWYFNCSLSTLMSGPPHYYSFKEYGPRKKNGQYVHTGDSVGVVVDTTRGDLSFVLNGVNRGVAYEGIPLDKPLVPCVILWYPGDSVELYTSEPKETEVDNSIPVPSNITVKSTTWDSITLTWGKVYNTSFYQVEVDGSKSCDAFTTNTFTKRGLFPETEHSFRVRAVKGSSVSVWSGAVKGRTLKAPEFSECVWKTCPDDVDDDRKYSVNWMNPRVATKVNSDGFCTIIGNTHFPLNTVTSWNIKILKSNYDGGGINIGIAPFDIDQNVDNYNKCGWYFRYCYLSILMSGPPHYYYHKKYGPKKEKDWGQYIHTGDSVGVVMDMTKGDLSFILNGVNFGVAYCGIPLDKPLVPCVLLWYPGDSVELGFALNEGNHGVVYEEITLRIKWICKQFHSILFFVTFLVVVIAAVVSYDGGTHV